MVSDNTGNTNGGSEKLDSSKYKSYRIFNTKDDGDIVVDSRTINRNSITLGE